MAKISFTLFSSSTLGKLKYLNVPQAEAVIEIKGPFTDPNSLQKFRDAISTSFEAHRKNLAGILEKQDEMLAKVKSEKERDKLLKELIKQQGELVKRVEKVLQEKIDAVVQKVGESANGLLLKQSQVGVSVTWSVYKLGKAALEVFFPDPSEGGGSSVENIAGIAKNVIDSVRELVKLAGVLSEFLQSEKDLRSQIEGTRKQIRGSKGKPTESMVNKLESQLKAHGPKLAAIEKNARGLATQLDNLLTKAEKGGDKMADALSGSVDKCIKQIMDLNAGLAKAEDYHQRSQDALRSAQKVMVKDPESSGIWDYLKKIDEWYEWVDEMFAKTTVSELEDALELAADELVKDFTE